MRELHPNEIDDDNNRLEADLRSDWWRNYGRLTGRSFDDMPKHLKRHDLSEITSQPLLNYLVALSYFRGKLNFSENVNLNAIYEDLVNAVYERGYEKRRSHTTIKHIPIESFLRILEEVGLAAWHGDGRTTTVREIADHCKSSGVGPLLEAFQEGAKAGVTRLLAAFFFRKHGQRSDGDPTFVFTHKSFGEYLAARRVVRLMQRTAKESIKRSMDPDDGWDEKESLRQWMTICGPSPITPYLLIFLQNEVTRQPVGSVGNWQPVFVAMFNHVLKARMPTELLQKGSFKELAAQVRNAEESLLAAANACARVTTVPSVIGGPLLSSFGSWFKSIQGQRTNKESALAAECLSYIEMRGAVLHIGDLFGVNLNHSDISEAHAEITCFTGAMLNGANLDNSQLYGSRFDHARGRKASFTRCKMSTCTMKDAFFEGANFDDAYLNDAILHKTLFNSASCRLTNFSMSRIIDCKFDSADLAGAKFNDAQIVSTTFSGANLTGANFTLADLTETDLHDPVWRTVDLSNAILLPQQRDHWLSSKNS